MSADHFNRQVDRAVLMAVVWLCGVIHEDCGAGDVLDNECLWAVHIQMKSVLSPSIILPSVLQLSLFMAPTALGWSWQHKVRMHIHVQRHALANKATNSPLLAYP